MSDLYLEWALFFDNLKSIAIIIGILAFSYGVVWYGLSGRLKEHTDWLFKKKKKNDVNSGAKYG